MSSSNGKKASVDRITRIKIEGFRRLKSLDLELRPLTVMIGANGVGKTSLLDALSLMSSFPQGKLSTKISDMGGFTNMLTRGQAESLILSVSNGKASGHGPHYSVQMKGAGTTFRIVREELSEGKARGIVYYIKPDSQGMRHVNPLGVNGKKPIQKGEWNLGLNALPALELLQRNIGDFPPTIGSFSKMVSTIALYRIPDSDSPRMPIRLPQQLRPLDELPSKDGGDLISLLHNFKESDPGRYETIEDTIRAAFPGFVSFGFPSVAAGMLSMTWKDSNFTKPFYLHELSAGTLKFLWLITFLQFPNLPAITMIDEPEGSLHPEQFMLLAHAFREASKRTQLIVATQSAALVRFLKPEEIVIMDMDDNGFATAEWADSLDLDKWLEDYSLDQLWARGVIGGR